MPTFELTYELKLVNNTAPLQVTKPQDALPYLFQHCFNIEQMWRERAVGQSDESSPLYPM